MASSPSAPVRVLGRGVLSSPVNIDSAAQVVYTLAFNRTPYLDIPNWDSWPLIATRLLRDGYRWPALTELADMEGASDQDAVIDAVARLAQQTRSDVGPAMNVWDIAAGLVAHIWKQGDDAASVAVLHLDRLWDAVPHSDREQGSRSESVKIIGAGVACWASFAHADVTAEAEHILARALKLIPPVPFSVPVCHAILGAFH